MVSRLLFTALVALGCSAHADGADPECLEAQEKPPTSLDWSDGHYRLCAPLFDAAGKRLEDHFEMTCTVYLDGAAVGSARLRPGRAMRGLHGRTGKGIATGVCEAGGLRSRPASPLEARLS